MALSSRERLLVTLLPAAVIAGGYFWYGQLFDTPAQSAERLQKKYEQLLEEAPPPNAVFEKSAEVNWLQKELERIETQQQEYLKRWQTLRGEKTVALEHQTDAMEHLTQMLKQNQLTILETGPASEDKLPPSLKAVTKQLSQESPIATEAKKSRTGRASSTQTPTSVQLWQVRFIGTYLQVVSVLEALAERDSEAIPVALDMEEARPGTNLRVWTIFVWL